MRIIAGQRRGHKLEGPKDPVTRPTRDMVREALFNILGAALEGKRVIDLFAGTGALGLEALSRGATHALFVERNRANGDVIRRNLAKLRFEARSVVITTDVFRWAGRDRSLKGNGDPKVPTIVFLDPPYREYDNHPGRMTRLLGSLIRRLPTGSALVVEFDESLSKTILPEPKQWDIRKYGGTCIAIRWLEEQAEESEDDKA